MNNLKIGARIFVSFTMVLLFLLGISVTSVISTIRTSSNIDKVDVYSGLKSSANELMHILNETRITADVLYKTQAADAYADISKQLMYCDLRLDKLYTYIDTYPELKSFRPDIEEFQTLYDQWHTLIDRMGDEFSLEQKLSARQEEAFSQLAGEARRLNLLCHEKLSNTILSMDDVSDLTMRQTKSFATVSLYIVIVVSLISLAAAMLLAVKLRRSITVPLGNMRDMLTQIGQTGDLNVPEEMHEVLRQLASGRDETAQCTEALLGLIERLHQVDNALAVVANGDLTADVALQSQRDTMGLAVRKMVEDLNQKFDTIAVSIARVYDLTRELDEGSRLLDTGSQSQAESVSHLVGSVEAIGDKMEKSAVLTNQAADLAKSIQDNAHIGTEKMRQMTQAAAEINEASQSISKVIKTIDDIAFQTNILALNAAVEAARAGEHGKGFAVVADEVRKLATRSAQAAQETGSLIENTIQKAALGASIAQMTSEALGMIVEGVGQSSTAIRDVANLSKEQEADVQQIAGDLVKVEKIVNQNSMISTQSAKASGEISDQSNLLKELVAQFKLRKTEDMPK